MIEASLRRGELLGPYEWRMGPARVIGLCDAAATFGASAPVVQAHALHEAYHRRVPALASCVYRHYVFDGVGVRLGLCVRRQGHEPADAHRVLLVSYRDSEEITAAVRRTTTPLPILEVS